MGCSFKQQALDNISRQFQYLTKFKEEDSLPDTSKKLKWDEAKKLLIENNITLQQSRRQVTQATDRRKRYWRNFIPGIQGAANLNQRLFDIESFSLNNINFSAFLTLRLPNPVTLPGTMQSLALAEYAAKERYILQERQATIRLFQTYLRYHSLEKRLTKLNKENYSKLSNSQEILSAIRKGTTTERGVKDIEEQLKRIGNEIAENLQIPYTNLTPVYESLPKLGYRNSNRDYVTDTEYGKLALRLLATRLESARLRVLQVKLNRFPSFNVSASAPQLFNSVASSDFDVERIALFGGISEGINFGTNEREQVEFSKEDYLYAVKAAQSEIRTNKETLRLAVRRMDRINGDLLRLKESRGSIAKLLKNDLRSSSFRAGLDELIKLDEQVEQLELQLRYQELEFWLWDEKKWK